MIKAVSSLINSGTGSLAEFRTPNLNPGLARGSYRNKLKRTFKQEKIQKLGEEETRLRASSSSGDYGGHLVVVDRDISNLQDRVDALRRGNSDSLPAQILINMVQQQSQQQNLITNLQREQQATETDLVGLNQGLLNISRSNSRSRSARSPSLPRRRSVSRSRERSPSPEREEREIGNEAPPSGLAQVRRGRGFNKAISNVNMRSLSIEQRRAMGLPDDANQSQVRAKVSDLGVLVTTGESGRPRPFMDIINDAIASHYTRIQQRGEEIRNIPIREESSGEDDTEADTE